MGFVFARSFAFRGCGGRAPGAATDDLIVEDGDYATQAAWLVRVAHVTNDLVAAGVLSGTDNGRVDAAAARWQNR